MQSVRAQVKRGLAASLLDMLLSEMYRSSNMNIHLLEFDVPLM